MAQQRGSASRIIFDTETVFKTNPTPDAMVFTFLPGESIKADREFSQDKG